MTAFNIKAPGGRVVDLKGKTLMPGLIDAHVHVGNLEIRNHLTAQLPPAVYVLKTCRNLETDLDLEFTTVRDAAGLDTGFRTAVDQGLVRGSRLLLSISPLVQSGGSTPGYGPGPDTPHPRNALGIYPEVCDGPDEVRAAARRTLGRGADQIKVFADGEVLAEFAGGRLPGALNVDIQAENFETRVGSFDRRKTFLVYCRSGNRSTKAIQAMERMNFESVYHMTEGIIGWEKK